VVWCKAKRVSMDKVRGEWFAYLVLVLLVIGRRLGQLYLDLLDRLHFSISSSSALHCCPRPNLIVRKSPYIRKDEGHSCLHCALNGLRKGKTVLCNL
jgi:hypothetical protein